MSQSLTAPGDRRRFGGFAQRADLQVAPLGNRPTGNDLVVVTLGADLSRWDQYREGNRVVVLDLVDAYLSENLSFKKILRGLYKTAVREFSRPVISFTALLTKAITTADLVICASEEQAQRLSSFNQSVTPIHDCLEELIELNPTNPGSILRPTENRRDLFWEGYAANLKHFSLLKTFERPSRHYTLNVVTDTTGWQAKQAHSRLQARLKPLSISLVTTHWSLESVVKVAKTSHIGVIPIDSSDQMAWQKSENKLLGMWVLKLPVITSNTPSYSRSMTTIGYPGLATDDQGWAEALATLGEDRKLASDVASCGYEYAIDRVSAVAVDQAWRGVFSGII